MSEFRANFLSLLFSLTILFWRWTKSYSNILYLRNPVIFYLNSAKKTLRLLSWWYNYAWREKHAMLRGRFVHKSQSIFSPKSQSIFSLSIWRSSLLMHYLIQKLYLKTSMMRTTPSVAAFFAWWHRGYKSYKLLSELALWSSLGKEAISETVFTSDSDHWPSPRVGKVKRVIG